MTTSQKYDAIIIGSSRAAMLHDICQSERRLIEESLLSGAVGEISRLARNDRAENRITGTIVGVLP